MASFWLFFGLCRGCTATGYAADAVAAHPALAAVRIEDAHHGVCPAVTGAQMQMMPSAPMEKCRRDSFSERAAMFSGTPEVRQSR